jgi:hypothetical protein
MLHTVNHVSHSRDALTDYTLFRASEVPRQAW